MKIPVPPPAPWQDLLAQALTPERLVALSKVTFPEDRAYEPWEWYKYHTPPAGMTAEEWWAIVRMRRDQSARRLPFSMLDGQRMSYNITDELLQAVDEVSAQARGVVELPEAIANSGTKDRYLIRSLIEESITSSQLEGASTSRRRAKEMIRDGASPRDRSERMILNNYQAMQFIVEKKDESLTPELISEIHRLVTLGTLDDPDDAGRLQRPGDQRVRIYGTETDDQVLHVPPRAELLPERIELLCRFANGDGEGGYIPPLLRSMTLHFMMGYDHYFADGNGRTARAVFYWSLLHQGFFLAEYLSISRVLKRAPAQYARSFLLSEQDQGDLTYFFLAQARALSRAIDDLHEYLRIRSESVGRTVGISRGLGLNHRQIALVDSLLRDPSQVVTVKGHSSRHGVVLPTARKDLLNLQDRGFLSSEKRGRQQVWFPVSDLEDLIRSAAEG